jgi:hypothetical protein
MRNRTFGVKSYLSQFVKHKVEEFDFRHTLYEVMREEHITSNPPASGETAAGRIIPATQRDLCTAAKNQHISRMSNSVRMAVTDATKELDGVRAKPYLHNWYVGKRWAGHMIGVRQGA